MWDSTGNLFSWGSALYGKLAQPCKKGSYNYNQLKLKRIEALSE
jgi:hypothetical protein